MGQNVSGKGDVKSFAAGDSLSAYRVVTFDSQSNTGIHIVPWVTDTQVIIGVTLGPASFTGEAVDVLLAAPTAKVMCNLSVSAGTIVGPATDGAGRVVERANPGTVTTFMVPTLGIALEAGDTNSVIEVLLQPLSQRPSDG